MFGGRRAGRRRNKPAVLTLDSERVDHGLSIRIQGLQRTRVGRVRTHHPDYVAALTHAFSHSGLHFDDDYTRACGARKRWLMSEPLNLDASPGADHQPSIDPGHLGWFSLSWSGFKMRAHWIAKEIGDTAQIWVEVRCERPMRVDDWITFCAEAATYLPDVGVCSSVRPRDKPRSRSGGYLDRAYPAFGSPHQQLKGSAWETLDSVARAMRLVINYRLDEGLDADVQHVRLPKHGSRTTDGVLRMVASQS